MPCAYPHRRKRRELRKPTPATSPHDISLPTPPSNQSPAAVQSPVGPDVVAERFLDPEVFSLAQLELPRQTLDSLITPEVEALVGHVGDIQATADMYFKTVHSWMPIVSRPSFPRTLISRMAHHRAELYLLVLSMKLICSREGEPRSSLYHTTRQLFDNAQKSGAISLMVLQSSILILLYEMGHAIYPDAYVRVAQCARYGTALGVDQSIASQNCTTPWTVDLEERRRVWWAILTIDR